MNPPRETVPHAPLGPLEAAVMDCLWSTSRPLGVLEVHAAVERPSPRSRNTVHTTLQRLVRKGLAWRLRQGRAHLYVATGTRRDWVAGTLERLVEAMGESEHHDVLVGFVDFAERTDTATLERLEQLVRRRLRERATEES